MAPYYEGWYMKQQLGDEFLAIIPGRAQDCAFVQVVTQDRAYYISYPLESYQKQAPRTGRRIPGGKFAGGSMRVGDNVFTPHGAKLAIDCPELELRGHLRYHERTPLRSDIMGPFAVLPMETKHVICSMRHRVEGAVVLNGDRISFDGGTGYMEGDRGHSFPRSYTWVQSIDFERTASVVLAIADIPIGGIRFTGCFAIVSLDGVEHRFATYRGARIVQADEKVVELAQRGSRLKIERFGSTGHALRAPESGDMRRTIHESPASTARFLFSKGPDILLDETCAHASYEHVS